MTFTNQQQLPYYLRAKAYDKYAPFIAEYLENGPYAHVPNGSTETFVSRFNYAVKAAIAYGYHHPTINKDDFNGKAKTLKCVLRPGCVLIGTLDWIKQWDSEHPKQRLTPKEALTINSFKAKEVEFFITHKTETQLWSLCELIAAKQFPGFIFSVKIDNDDIRLKLELELDVIIEETKEVNVYRIL